MKGPDASSEVFRRELARNGGFAASRREDWVREVERSLKGAQPSTLASPTHEGLNLGPLYADDDVDWTPGFPGLAPYTRGARATTVGGWEVCQAVTEADPTLAASAMAHDVGCGASSVWVVFDVGVRSGCDADDPALVNEAADGVVVSTTDELDALFDPVNVARTPVRLAAGGHAFGVAAAFVAAARRHRLDPGGLAGSFDLDPLGALAEDGELIYGLDRSLALMPDVVAWTARHARQVQPVAVSTLPYHMSGATAVEEIAYALATGVEYLRCLLAAGVELHTACRCMRMVTAIGRDLFMEVAKLRALRWTWARVVEVAGGPPEAGRIAVHAVTSPRTVAVRDPWTNLLRVSVESFAASVGGADVITSLPFDAAIGPPDALSRRLAVNTQTILREESHLDRVADPAGGSWYVERLTVDLAEAAWQSFQRIEAGGGMRALFREDAGLGAELGRALAARRAAIATRRDPVTGVSSYPNLAETPVDRNQPDLERLRAGAAGRLAAHRAGGQARDELERVAEAASRAMGDGEVFSAAVDAAGAGATLGELARALAGGERASRIVPLPSEREGWMFERLRDASEAFLAVHGLRPRVFLAAMGPLSVHRARSGFAADFFRVGGFETVGEEGFADVAAAVGGLAASKARIAAVCSSDALYLDLVSELVPALRAAGARTVVLVGRPDEHEAAWRAAGVDRFIFAGCDAHAVLRALLIEEGALHD